MITNKNVDKKS